jgi:hypothetical protein
VEAYAKPRASSGLTPGVDQVNIESEFDKAKPKTIVSTGSCESIAEGWRGIGKRGHTERQIPNGLPQFQFPTL